MDQPPAGSGPGGADGHRGLEEWAETLARTVAHLAAQLTLSQIRLRALATELQERDAVAPGAVAARARAIATTEGGGYLRENLGEALVEIIDVEALERDLVAFLDEAGGA